jgi:hypothetical protein
MIPPLHSFAMRFVPELRFAKFTQSLITGAATLAGAAAGAARGVDETYFPK